MCKIFKKVLIIFITISLILGKHNLIYADDSTETENINILEEVNIINASAKIDEEPVINSRAAIIYDRKTKEIIWSKNENNKRPMASTTKIMTGIIILENCTLSDTVEISKKAAGIGGSRLGLKANDKVTVQDLLYGLLMVSGNDAAVALAEHAAGSVENFAELMNKKAQELDLKDTNFVTPHGLDSEEHYTTAYELAKITDYALENKTFAKMVGTKNFTVTINGNPKNLSNTNELLGNLDGVNGVKTGFTNGANRCLVTSVNRNNMNIITVVLGADTKKLRTSDSIKLIEYAYKNYKNMKVTDLINEKYNTWKNEYEKKIYINKGKKEYINTKIADINNEYISIKNGKEDDIYVQIDTLNYIDSPIEENKIVGKIRVFLDDEEKICIDILNSEYIEKKTLIDYYIELLKNDFQNMYELYI